MNGEMRIDIRLTVAPGERLFPIGAAARMSGMHPQTLRQYDRLGLVRPSRTAGRGRRYTAGDIETLREVQRLSTEEGINLAGIARILALRIEVNELRREVERLQTAAALAHRVFAVAPGGDATALARGQRPAGTPPRPVTNRRALVLWRPM
ncbi:MAG: helix-turn-helix transcriptional regulator [Micrococcales bacterium]|nr:helix-turn-helix transcriptional regulator [Micrococcales bacterium]